MVTDKDETAADGSDDQRSGAYREIAFEAHGRQCADCGWSPSTPVEESKLHVHHITPISEGGVGEPENLEVLCQDHHLQRHSESVYSHELVGRLANALADVLTHKKDGFSDRVARRVRLGSVEYIDGNPPTAVLPNESDSEGYHLVEGILNGDHYDTYFVDRQNPYLGMCSCYEHSFGTHRAENICTHVGAAIVNTAVGVAQQKSEEKALQFIHDIGEDLDTEAADYVETREMLTKGIDTLDIENRFSEHYADRARRQAKWLTRYGNLWKVYGGECEGCEIRLTAEGYRCTDSDWCDKWPCPGKLAAHILDAGDARQEKPDFGPGQAFEVETDNVLDGVGSGSVIVVEAMDEDNRTITFKRIADDITDGTILHGYKAQKSHQKIEASFSTVVDAIHEDKLAATSVGDSIADIHFEKVVESEYGPKVAIKAPYDAKEHFESLSEKKTRRNWNTTIGRWTIDPAEVGYVANELANHGWVVSLPDDILTEAKDAADDVTEDDQQKELSEIVFKEPKDDGQIPIDSPYEAKDDIKGFDKDDTGRGWDGTFWNIDPTGLDTAVEGLENAGWDVYVTDAAQEAAEQATSSNGDTEEDNTDIIVDGVTTAEDANGETATMLTLKTPMEAREDLLDLDKETTGRRWHPQKQRWVIRAESVEEVISDLIDAGWVVEIDD